MEGRKEKRKERGVGIKVLQTYHTAHLSIEYAVKAQTRWNEIERACVRACQAAEFRQANRHDANAGESGAGTPFPGLGLRGGWGGGKVSEVIK